MLKRFEKFCSKNCNKYLNSIFFRSRMLENFQRHMLCFSRTFGRFKKFLTLYELWDSTSEKFLKIHSDYYVTWYHPNDDGVVENFKEYETAPKIRTKIIQKLNWLKNFRKFWEIAKFPIFSTSLMMNSNDIQHNWYFSSYSPPLPYFIYIHEV